MLVQARTEPRDEVLALLRDLDDLLDGVGRERAVVAAAETAHELGEGGSAIRTTSPAAHRRHGRVGRRRLFRRRLRHASASLRTGRRRLFRLRLLR